MVTCVERRQAPCWSEPLSFPPAPRSCSQHSPSPLPSPSHSVSPWRSAAVLPFTVRLPSCPCSGGRDPVCRAHSHLPSSQDSTGHRVVFLPVERKSRRCRILSAGFTAVSRVTCVRGKAAHCRPSLPGGAWGQGAGPHPRPVPFFRSLGQAARFQQRGSGSSAEPINPGPC